jgi:RNA polymerase sigma-70 factor (ECF subfamily)
MRPNVVAIATAKIDSGVPQPQEPPLSLDAFLAHIEKRAYRTALFTCRNSADALDIVQDAMMQLVQYYRARPAQEWPLLFQRILQNRITDWHRQQSSRRKWFWRSPMPVDDDNTDVLDSIVDTRDINPEKLLERARDIDTVLATIEKLPLRQRQAFLLRTWEGLDVADTATAMQCSEGAVKSHLFRALQTIKQALGEES